MMKKKIAMLLALVMTVTSIEGSAFAVRGADFAQSRFGLQKKQNRRLGQRKTLQKALAQKHQKILSKTRYRSGRNFWL